MDQTTEWIDILDIIDISKEINIIGSKFDNDSNPPAPNGTLDASVTPAA